MDGTLNLLQSATHIASLKLPYLKSFPITGILLSGFPDLFWLDVLLPLAAVLLALVVLALVAF
jgi:hypothetical protein